MESPILQTDDRLSKYPEIARAGCLVRSLLAIAEADTGILLSAKQILDAYEYLREINDVDPYRGVEKDCYVMGHTDAIDIGLQLLGSKKQSYYIESQSKNAKVRGFKSAIPMYPNYYINHYKYLTKEGRAVGHFVLASKNGDTLFDPYFPWHPPKTFMSFRMYAVE